MTDRLARIRFLQDRRAFYRCLGKRKKLIQIDAELVPLVSAQLAHENTVAQVAADLEWLAGVRKDGEAA